MACRASTRIGALWYDRKQSNQQGIREAPPRSGTNFQPEAAYIHILTCNAQGAMDVLDKQKSTLRPERVPYGHGQHELTAAPSTPAIFPPLDFTIPERKPPFRSFPQFCLRNHFFGVPMQKETPRQFFPMDGKLRGLSFQWKNRVEAELQGMSRRECSAQCGWDYTAILQR